MHAPLVVALDVNETLSDLTPLRARLVAVGAPPGLLDTWFAATLRDGFALAAAGGFAPFLEIGTAVLEDLLTRQDGVTGTPREAAEEVLAGMSVLGVHPDVAPALGRLRDRGVRVVTLGNGAASSARGLLERAGLADLVERCLSVEEVGRWKPAPEPYLHAASTCGVEPGEVALVAVHPWDVDGARRAGLVTGHVARGGGPYPAHLLPPTVAGTRLDEVVQALLGPGGDPVGNG